MMLKIRYFSIVNFVLLTVLIFFATPIKADVVMPSCAPYTDNGRAVNILLNDPDFSILKEWGNYKLKSLGCFVDLDKHQDRIPITGYYHTPTKLSKYSISYFVGFETEPTIPTTGTDVYIRDTEIKPSKISSLIQQYENNPRVGEFISKFGANDANIGNWNVTYRNKDSNYAGCTSGCGTGLQLARDSKGYSYSLPLNLTYQNFPEFVRGKEILQQKLLPGCKINEKENVTVIGGWEFHFPIDSKLCNIDFRGKDIAVSTYQPDISNSKIAHQGWEGQFEYKMNPPAPPIYKPSISSKLSSFIREVISVLLYRILGLK